MMILERQKHAELNFSKILKRYMPDENEKRKKHDIAEDIMKRLSSEIEKRGIDADTILVGSLARGTALKNSDVDIFIRFSRNYERAKMERVGIELGFSIFPDATPKYAEHPYVSSVVKGTKVDIVPCYRIDFNTPKISSVDRTPLHTQYMKEKLTDKSIGEVILLKLFLRRQGIYGSELKTEGFSGYVCELLILHFGTFNNFMEHMSGLSGRLIIQDQVKEFHSPVVIVDPVDLSRNAGAAVSNDSLSILKTASKFFCLNPSEDYFYYDENENIEPVNHERGTYFLALVIERPDIIDDILFPQVHLTRRKLDEFAKIQSLPILNIFDHMEEKTVTILMEFASPALPSVEKKVGPPAGNMNVVSFIEKHIKSPDFVRGPFVENGRVIIEVRRKITQFRDIFMSNLENINFGKNLSRLKSGTSIIDNQEEIKKSYAYREFLSVKSPYLAAGKDLKK